jgi:hypothetical protein
VASNVNPSDDFSEDVPRVVNFDMSSVSFFRGEIIGGAKDGMPILVLEPTAKGEAAFHWCLSEDACRELAHVLEAFLEGKICGR